MALDEPPEEPALPERCEVCGAQLIPSEQQAIIDSGGPPLCSIHAAEVVPLEDDPEIDTP